MKERETYKVVVELPRTSQQKLHNEKAKRQLSGKKQTVNQIASELLEQKVDEIQPA